MWRALWRLPWHATWSCPQHPGGQAQLITVLSLQGAEDRFGALLGWIAGALRDDDRGSQVRGRLAAGGNRIRTCGPTSRLVPLTLVPTTENLCGMGFSQIGTEGLRRQNDAAAATRRA